MRRGSAERRAIITRSESRLTKRPEKKKGEERERKRGERTDQRIRGRGEGGGRRRWRQLALTAVHRGSRLSSREAENASRKHPLSASSVQRASNVRSSPVHYWNAFRIAESGCFRTDHRGKVTAARDAISRGSARLVRSYAGLTRSRDP